MFDSCEPGHRVVAEVFFLFEFPQIFARDGDLLAVLLALNDAQASHNGNEWNWWNRAVLLCLWSSEFPGAIFRGQSSPSHGMES
jgi:hypothetical protein